MATTLVIPGFPTSYKVPGAYGQTLFGQGKSATGLVGLKLLLEQQGATVAEIDGGDITTFSTV